MHHGLACQLFSTPTPTLVALAARPRVVPPQPGLRKTSTYGVPRQPSCFHRMPIVPDRLLVDHQPLWHNFFRYGHKNAGILQYPVEFGPIAKHIERFGRIMAELLFRYGDRIMRISADTGVTMFPGLWERGCPQPLSPVRRTHFWLAFQAKNSHLPPGPKKLSQPLIPAARGSYPCGVQFYASLSDGPLRFCDY